ncbi:hypothetical protein LCGC14_2768240 [marine sediment metagenome]|uniref:Uncharacterized protein n=1 Tax=marine sediment metagenome TaxID=412755 RepID=A0A0F8YWX2_9ZZZZ
MATIETLRVKVEIVWANKEALKALVELRELISSLEEDLPWRDEIPEAVAKMDWLVENVTVQQVDNAAD